MQERVKSESEWVREKRTERPKAERRESGGGRVRGENTASWLVGCIGELTVRYGTVLYCMYQVRYQVRSILSLYSILLWVLIQYSYIIMLISGVTKAEITRWKIYYWIFYYLHSSLDNNHMKSAQAVLRPSGSRQIQGVAPSDMILTVIHWTVLVLSPDTEYDCSCISQSRILV